MVVPLITIVSLILPFVLAACAPDGGGGGGAPAY